jgi:hypothetical protein
MPQPDPPQYLDFDGKRYVLVKNTSARYGRSPSVDLSSESTIITESSLDLESNARTAFTEVRYFTPPLKANSNIAGSSFTAGGEARKTVKV